MGEHVESSPSPARKPAPIRKDKSKKKRRTYRRKDELEGMHLIGSPPVCTKAKEWGVGLPKALTSKQEETSRNSPAMMRMMRVMRTVRRASAAFSRRSASSTSTISTTASSPKNSAS